jgi:hypothetical protein
MLHLNQCLFYRLNISYLLRTDCDLQYFQCFKRCHLQYVLSKNLPTHPNSHQILAPTENFFPVLLMNYLLFDTWIICNSTHYISLNYLKIWPRIVNKLRGSCRDLLYESIPKVAWKERGIKSDYSLVPSRPEKDFLIYYTTTTTTWLIWPPFMFFHKSFSFLRPEYLQVLLQNQFILSSRNNKKRMQEASNGRHHNLYPLPDIIITVNSRIKNLAGNVAKVIDLTNMYRAWLANKFGGEEIFVRPSRRRREIWNFIVRN